MTLRPAKLAAALRLQLFVILLTSHQLVVAFHPAPVGAPETSLAKAAVGPLASAAPARESAQVATSKGNSSGPSPQQLLHADQQDSRKKVEQFAQPSARNQSAASGAHDGGRVFVLPIQVTAIHVDKSEFPLSKLLFNLTLRLALSEASRFLEQQQQAVVQLRRPRQDERNQQQPARRQLGKVRVELKLIVRSANTCSRQYAGALAAEEFYVRRSRLFIVSGCDAAIRAVSRLASGWRVPIMTAAGFGADLNDKSVHRSLIRVAFSLRAAVEFLFKIMRSFQWRRVNLVVDESDANSLALRGSIEQFAQRATSKVEAHFQVALNTISFDLQALLRNNQAAGDEGDELSGELAAATNGTSRAAELEAGAEADRWPNELSDKVIRDSLWQCSIYSRVTVLLMPQEFVRKFMLSAHDQQMANGLYTFINMPLLAQEAPAASVNAKQTQQQQRESFGPPATGEDAFIWRSAGSRRNAQAKRAFESLMSIYLRTPATKAYVYFASRLANLANARANLAPAPGRNDSSLAAPARKLQLNITPYSASFYDGLQIYASLLNESLATFWPQLEGAPPPGANATDALHARISELVRARRFDNMVTGNIYINANGDRETDYTLDDMNQMTGKFAPVIWYRGETRDIERLGRVHWSSDASVGPTSDAVDCLLAGSCAGKPVSRFTFVLLLLAGPLLLLLAGLFYFVHNRLSLESQLVDSWWKIHLSDLEIVLTRRKRANDGSLVMQSESGGGGAGGSSISSQDQANSSAAGGGGGGGAKRNRLLIGGSGRRSHAGSVIGVGGLAIACDKTEVTRATNTSGGWASSALDACYGNITLGVYKLAKVALKPIGRFHQSRKLMIELRCLKEISHTNLCRFVGILVDEGSLALVSEFCPKGSLREFFHNESMVIDWTFKYSIINDILAGLAYLHASPLAFHGRLKSSNCLVSARFVVKLSDYGPHSLYEQLDEDKLQQQRQDDLGELDWLRHRLWLAPEHLKRVAGARAGSSRADVYSFGLLLYEITTNCLPFFDGERNDFVLPPRQLLEVVRARGPHELLAPSLSALDEPSRRQPEREPSSSPRPLVELMQACWRLEPAKRPSLSQVSGALKKVTRGVTSKKLLENLTARMEQYTNNLESLVEAKLACLLEEKQRSEELLYQFVPRTIASLLKEGQFVEPEAFECVTVFYSDIVGFTALSSQSSPMQVVDFLSNLYLCFDETLEQHDIFKVDTIGDAYIVASGLPQRNEDKHALEIARAALELRERLKNFKIPHKPEHNLEMRVGIHSGPCIAGIVGGLNMPKYCVFGDTLTTGKFMESSGLPMKIHITEEARALLAGRPDFSVQPRQPRITRDGLPFQTYWLERASSAE